ncbi:unnamed protein product [Medioppia subpectinata]|uniref:Nuclear receptor domain-containing protein n=1 Tax=Medioppia subpectinata TaxID=1979941 RepID=A0A7R9KKS5_9ACAR|nr:unnamed protein product [Medioppia subpectinata]CAG2105285.1 unnamed protein product [Medioppia subpectinata]
MNNNTKTVKICQICGDYKQVGRNYGAITCETCKAFFRRLSLKDNNCIECVSDGNCIITSQTRKMCQKCRLDKCLAVGMKSQIIRSDEENEWRRRMGEEKRRQKLLKTTSSSSLESKTMTISSDSSQECNEIDVLIDSTADINDEVLNGQIMDIENSCHLDQELNDSQLPAIPVFESLVDYNGINQLQLKRISELLGASKVFTYPSSKTIMEIPDMYEIFRRWLTQIQSAIQSVDKRVVETLEMAPKGVANKLAELDTEFKPATVEDTKELEQLKTQLAVTLADIDQDIQAPV